MIGRKDHSPIVFQLQDPNDSRRIFKKMSDVKPKNVKDRKIIIKEYLDEEDREEKRRHQDLIKDNRNLPISHQCTMKHQKMNLEINASRYEKEVFPPSMKEILLKAPSQIDMEEKLGIHNGSMRSENGSTFYAHAVQADNFEKIREVYAMLKEEHLSASHIMCGYRIFGTRHYNLQDFSNDGEHSGGRVILEQIRNAKVWNLAVFIVRYHEGPNLGRRRLEIIEELTKDVIQSFPSPLNYGLNFVDKDLIKAFDKMETERNKKPERRTNKSEENTENIDT